MCRKCACKDWRKWDPGFIVHPKEYWERIGSKVFDSVYINRVAGDCKGCHRTAYMHVLVLASFLYKLKVIK